MTGPIETGNAETAYAPTGGAPTGGAPTGGAPRGGAPRGGARSAAVETAYAPVNGLQMYYELHGPETGTPLLLLHGGLFNVDLQFGAPLPGLSEGRRVIATDFQGHGRTNDADRPLSVQGLTADVVALVEHLGVGPVDVWGYSIGGAVALSLAIEHPDLVRKAIISSVSFDPSGDRGSENAEAVGAMTVDLIAGTPMEADYLAKSPHPDHEHLQVLLDKLGGFISGVEGRSEEAVRGFPAPTLITVGDCDMVRLDHAVRFLQLRGGDVNGDFAGVPAAQLAVLPGTTHFAGLSNAGLVLEIVRPFLEAPLPGGAPGAVPGPGGSAGGAPGQVGLADGAPAPVAPPGPGGAVA